jgi:ribose 5-phosphate isomerase B
MATEKQKIAIASDHGAYELKSKLVTRLADLGYEPVDLGTNSDESVDYPDYALLVADAVVAGDVEKGILLCGTGIGMSIAANKIPGIRAALVHDRFTAEMSRKHNDANILVLGGRTTGDRTAYDILDTWLTTNYEGGRHDQRLGKIATLETKELK